MAEDRFDDILKEKLEAYEPQILPSAVQMDRLLASAPISSPSFFSTTTGIAASLLILILTVSNLYYLVKVNWLEEDIQILREFHVSNHSFLTDTLTTRSYSHKSIVDNDDFDNSDIKQNVESEYSDAKIAQHSGTTESQKFPNESSIDDQNLASIIEVISTNPEVADHIIRTILKDPKFNSQVEMIVMEESRGTEPSKETSNQNEDRNGLDDRVVSVEDLSESRNAGQTIIPIDSDQIVLSDSTGNMQLNLPEYIAKNEQSEVQEVTITPLDSSVVMPGPSRSEVIRKKRLTVRNHYNLEAGLGLNFGKLSNEISSSFPNLSIRGEVIFGERLALLSGFDFSSIGYEVDEDIDIDESLLSNLTSDQISQINELKVNLLIINMPLETRFYFMPIGKFQPYLETGIIPSYLISERIEAEIIDNSEEVTIPINPSNEVSKLSISSYKLGMGSRFEISNKLSGGVSISYQKGINSINSLGDKLDNVQVKFMIIRMLK